MKKILSLLLLIPLTTIAAEHGGKPMQGKAQTQRASEHGGKAMETKEHGGKPMQEKAQTQKTSEHGGKAMGRKEQADKSAEHTGTAAEAGGQPLKKNASE